MASVRDWDDGNRSERGSRPVTVRRYKISDIDDHDDDRWETTSRVSRRETEPSVRSHSRGVTREYRFERKVSRSPSPEVRQIRVERAVSRDPPRRDRGRDDYDLDHYVRSTEYYERERPERSRSHHREPQTIIIKNEAPSPIIIREREHTEGREVARAESSSSVEEKKEEVLETTTTKSHRSASVDGRQLARRDQSPDEDYYYQRTTREIARRPRDDYDDYRQNRRHDDNYSDDDVYYRRTEYTDPDEHTMRDPNHRRHLAEGAVLGLGAAALLNHDRKKKGEKSGGAGNLIGGAALGAAGTELYSRARQHWGRERSKSRGRYDDYDRDEREEHHGILGDNHNVAKLGAVAVIGALAGYAASRKGKKDGRRSRSRRRRHSRAGSRSRSRSSSGERAPSAAKRNSTIAGAGLASAAVAGLVERARSKSRPGRSRSRLRTGLPIAAAGLGGAALAGLYENNKAKKAKAHAHARSVSGSPVRDHSRSVGPDERSREMANDDHLIEYGEGSIAPDHGRPRSRADSYYSDYGRRHGSPSSAESSPRRHRHGHGAEEAAAAGGMAGIAAHEASKRRERKRAERERRREEEERNETPQQGYGFGPYAQELPPPAAMPPPAAGYNNNPYYPQPSNFAPPPNAYSPVPNFTGQPQFSNAQDFAQPQPQYSQGTPAGAQAYGYPAAPAPAEGNGVRFQPPGNQM